MLSILVFIKYNGSWDGNNVYRGYKTMSVLILMGKTYAGLLDV